MAVPDPPTDLRPRVTTWTAGRAFSRIHPLQFRPTDFLQATNASVKGRFHFFERADGVVVPVLYGAESADAANAEVLFRNVPVRGGRFIRMRDLSSLAISLVTPKRDLALIELFGHGLRRLEVTADQLTSTVTAEYPRTIAWAQRLHESLHRADGLVWMSRQFNAAQALMLFGDRVQENALDCSETLELSAGNGFELVRAAANAAEITITT
jgi:hypothetical protein